MGTTMTGFGSTYTVPIHKTFDIAVYALFLTVFTVPMTVIVNRYVAPPPRARRPSRPSQRHHDPAQAAVARAAARAADPAHADGVLQAVEDLPRAGPHPRAHDPRPLARRRPAHRARPPPPEPPRRRRPRRRQQQRRRRQAKRRQVVQPIQPTGKRQHLRVDRVPPLRRPLLHFRAHSVGSDDDQVDNPGT